MRLRLLILVVLGLTILPTCMRRNATVSSPEVPTQVIPPPQIAPGGPIATFAAYEEAVNAAQKSLPADLQKESGPKRLVAATRALAALKSEPARSYARSLIALLQANGIEAGPVPGRGDATISYKEMAVTDALSQNLMRGPESADQGPAPTGPNAIPYGLHLQILFLISREAPSEVAALSAAFNTTNPLPVDVSTETRLTPAAARQLCAGAWANLRSRLTDSSRSINLSFVQFASPSFASLFTYALYYEGNALASTPEVPLTGRELEDMVEGYDRISKAAQKLDPSVSSNEIPTTESLDGLTKFARIIDENVATTRAARADLVRFFNALSMNDDAVVGALSSNSRQRTAAQWRDYFDFDRPNPAKSLEVVSLGVTGSAGRIAVGVKKTDASGKVDDEEEFVTIAKRGNHWIILEG